MNNQPGNFIWRECGLILTGVALLLGTTVDLAPNLIWHDQQRVEQIVLLGIVALAVTLWLKTPVIPLVSLPGPSRWALGLGFMLGCVSAGLSAYPRFAGLEWSTLLLLTGLTFVLAEQAWARRHCFDILAIRLMLGLAVVIALKIMAAYMAAIVEGMRLDTLALFEGTFSNRRVFGQVASLLVPLLAYPLLLERMPRIQRWGVFALLTVWWMLVIVSGTRGTWMALAVASLTLAVVAWQASSAWLRIQVSALGVGALLFGILFVGLPTWLVVDASLENRLINFATLSGREVLWGIAWEQIQAHPWLGIGPMHFAAIRNNFGAHPHNAVLQLAAEWGIPAALAFIVPIGFGILRLLAKIRQQEVTSGPLFVCLTASILAISAQSMVDGVLVIPYTQTWLVLIAGWTLGVYFRDVVVPHVSISGRTHLGISILSLIVVSALLYGIFPEVLNRVEVTQVYADGGKLIPPRYWGVGWIP